MRDERNNKKYVNEFIKNPAKIRLITKVLALFFVSCFFVKVGLSASILWYVVIAAVLFFAFKKPNAKKESIIHSQLFYSVVCFVLILTTAFYSFSNDGNNSSGLFGNWGGPKEICITMQAEVNQDNGRVATVGNYGMIHAIAGYFTDVITVPQGKMWIFNRQEINYYGKEGLHPDVCYYNLGDTNAIPKLYNCYTEARSIPIFRGNDKLRIRVKHTYIGNGWSPQSMKAKIYFIEKEDDLLIK